MSIFYLFTNYDADYLYHNNIIYVYHLNSSSYNRYATPSILNELDDISKLPLIPYVDFKHLLNNRIHKDLNDENFMKSYIKQLIEKIIYEKL